jgi:hypothetical protein
VYVHAYGSSSNETCHRHDAVARPVRRRLPLTHAYVAPLPTISRQTPFACPTGARPGVQPHGGSGGRQHKASSVFVVLVVLAVMGGIFGAWYHFLASPAARAQVEDLAYAAKSFGSSLVGLVGDKVGEWTGRGRGGLGGGGGFGGGFGGGGGGGSAGAGRYVPLDEELNYFQPLPAAGADAAEVVVVGVPPAPLPRDGGGRGGGGAGGGVFTIR